MQKDGVVIVIKTLFFYVCRYVPPSVWQDIAVCAHSSPQRGIRLRRQYSCSKKVHKKMVDITVSVC